MTKCAWRDGCAHTAEEGDTLCEEHIAEARRLRAIRRQTFADAKQEQLESYYYIGKALHAAEKAGVMAALAAEEPFGDCSVVVGHARTNSKLYNYVTGKSKASPVPVAGWETAPFIRGAIFKAAEGLSLEAARLYADEYNAILQNLEIDDTTAIVS